jgi:hypothetical protein
MSLINDPFYKSMIEGYDTKILVGTMGTELKGPWGVRTEIFPLFLIDYHGFPSDMDPFVADAFDGRKKVNLREKDGTYSVGSEEQGTVMMFAHGEQATHTAPTFWAEFKPEPEGHAAFQKELARLGIWMLMIITKNRLREIVVARDGAVIASRIVPLTDELKKMLGVE